MISQEKIGFKEITLVLLLVALAQSEPTYRAKTDLFWRHGRTLSLKQRLKITEARYPKNSGNIVSNSIETSNLDMTPV